MMHNLENILKIMNILGKYTERLPPYCSHLMLGPAYATYFLYVVTVGLLRILACSLEVILQEAADRRVGPGMSATMATWNTS